MLRDNIHDLNFSIEVSIRYHDRRRGFFDTLHKTVRVVGMLGISAAAAGLTGYLNDVPAGREVGIGGAFTGALLLALDVVVGFAESARLHDSLYRKFYELMAEIARAKDPSEDEIHGWLSRVLIIERDEPPSFHALYILCHNEVVYVMKYPRTKMHKISFHHRILAHIVPFRQFNYESPES